MTPHVPVPSTIEQVDRHKPVAFILHGILGNGRNWLPFARAMAHRLPDWQFLLLDLRGHGESPAPTQTRHTLRCCARDVEHLGERLGRAADVVIGHSFGGKVAMDLLACASHPPKTTWVLDSWMRRMPVERLLMQEGKGRPEEVNSITNNMIPGSSVEVMSIIEDFQTPIAERKIVADKLSSLGYSKATCAWMLSNLKQEKDSKGNKGYVWRFDLRVAKELILDAASVDSMPLLQEPRGHVGIIRAGHGLRWTAEAVKDLEACAERTSLVRSFLLPNTGHWIHVDAPEEVMNILTPSMERVHS